VSHSLRLIAILRATLRRVEEQFGRDDPSILQLKRSILQAIAELEIKKIETANGKGKAA
jgi:hypothetical protein